MKRITATDAAFLHIESAKSPMIIGGLAILDPSTASGSFVRHRDILSYVESRLHVSPGLRRRLVHHPLGLDEPRLIDDPDFDLEFHVRHIALPRPRDLRQLKILSSRLISRPMDLDRPLWELYIIEGLENVEGAPDDAFAMLIKVHHATFDGRAAAAAIWAFMQDTPGFEPVPPEERWVPDRMPDAVDWTVTTVAEGVRQAVTTTRALPALAKGLYNGLRPARDDSGDGGGEKPRRASVPKTRFQQKITSHRVFDWARWDIGEVQALRAALGKPKMNDLLLTVVGGGMRRYLSSHGELPEQPLVAICPISVRAGDPKEGGNQVSGMRVTLATDTADPLERLAAIAEATARGKEQAEALGGDFMGGLLALAPFPLRSRLLRGLTSLSDRFSLPTPNMANTVVTNVPNPPGGHYFTGARVLSYAGFGPIAEGIGIFHTISGMDFEVNLSVTSCREHLPDLEFYMDCLRESFSELQAAAGQKSSTAPAAKKPRGRPRKAAAV